MYLRGRLRRRRESAGAAFGLRLAIAFVLTLSVVGAVGYFYIKHQLRASQIRTYAADQRADAATFERYGARAATPADAIRRIDQLLDAIARREGTLETLLIDRDHIIRASGQNSLVDTEDQDTRIDAALLHGSSYAGLEGNAARDGRDFEFVTAVDLPSGRYAYEVSYDHAVFDAQIEHVLSGIVGLGLLALLGSAVFFYFGGGRPLLRSHRAALERAMRDGLTDLPNQRAFQDEFPQSVAAAARNQESLALIAFDVDDFKFLNDRYGHPHGDAVLKRVAAVLLKGRPGDRAYRVGGDEFAFVLPHTDAEGVRVLAKRLQRNLAEAKLVVSVGISALRPGQPADVLRAEADAALYEAKRLGGNRVSFFDDIRDHVSVTSSDKRGAVRRLIEEGRLTTAYQPIWDFSDGRLIGVEALMRPDEKYGLSGPAEAFDIAEEIGRVHELDVLCVRHALRAVPELPEGALLFLNICPQTLDLDAEENDWLRGAVESAGLPVERVVVEMTERTGGRTAAILKCLQRLRAQGFKLAIDDIGAGTSGLSIMRHFKAEFVKLDRTIVAAAPIESGARAVLMAIATYARQTGAFVIAEGIEDEETLEYLRSIDAKALRSGDVIQGGQGYSLGRPETAIHSSTPEPLRALPHAA